MKCLESFSSIQLSESMQAQIKELGLVTPTRIQSKLIPLILNSNLNLVACSETGSGKTAAFTIPIIEQLNKNNTNKLRCIIISPVRELSVQIYEELNKLNYNNNLKSICCYGGVSIDSQIEAINNGVDIIVATPGRLIDILNRNIISLNELEYLVLDEFDNLLDSGFTAQIEEIFQSIYGEPQKILLSATFPEKMKDIIDKYIGEYKIIEAERLINKNNLINNIYYNVVSEEKINLLSRIIDANTDFYGIIFVRTKLVCDTVTRSLVDLGYNVEGLHGDHSQLIRENVLYKFKIGYTKILIATDLAARGIDVKKLTHVVNFSFPHDFESFIHRSGRVGRAGHKGTAITFVMPSEQPKWNYIMRNIDGVIQLGSIPTIKDIIKSKRNSFITDLLGNDSDMSLYYPLVNEILDSDKYKDIFAKMIKEYSNDFLNKEKYTPINTNNENVGVRLFLAVGKKHGYNAKKIIKLIRDQVNIHKGNINEIKVYDAFSFATVPADRLVEILDAFKKPNERSIVAVAKQK